MAGLYFATKCGQKTETQMDFGLKFETQLDDGRPVLCRLAAALCMFMLILCMVS